MQQDDSCDIPVDCETPQIASQKAKEISTKQRRNHFMFISGANTDESNGQKPSNSTVASNQIAPEGS